MPDSDNYWFEEGQYAFKAGISLVELGCHYPKRNMNTSEWNDLEKGWVCSQTQFLEQMGQARLF